MMKFQIYPTSGDMKKYIDKLKKYNLLHNIREEQGTYFIRKYEDYFIEIKDLQELCNLSNELNEEIIFWDGCLEIYDDYRE